MTLFCASLVAQQNLWLFNVSYSQPGSFISDHDFGATDSNGLFAQTGGGFEIEHQCIFDENIGFNLFYGYSRFGLREQLLGQSLGAISTQQTGAINSHNFGAGPAVWIPVGETGLFWSANLSGGIRFMNLPLIDLTYDPTENRFVNVSYENGTNVSLFWELATGFQYMFDDQWGINVNASYIAGGVNTFDYDFFAFGSRDISGSDEARQSVDYLNIQAGIIFKVKKRSAKSRGRGTSNR